MYPITPLVQVLFQLSSLTIAHHNLGFNSSYLTLLVPMSSSCRPTSHHTVFWILKYSPFLTKCIVLEMCMVYFLFLSFLAIHTYDLLSNIIKGACYGNTYVSLFRNSLFSILDYTRAIPAVNPVLYSLSALD